MIRALDLFSHRLGLFLAEKGWNQVDLSRATGISPQQINNYVKARTPPGLETIEKIAGALGKPVFEFFKEEIVMKFQPHVTSDVFSEDKVELLSLWTNLTEENKATVINLVKGLVAGKSQGERHSQEASQDPKKKSRS